MFTGPYVLSPFPTICGTRGTELYMTSYLGRCVCTAFACGSRVRVSSVIIPTRYFIDTCVVTHELRQRTRHTVAALYRVRTDPQYVRPQQLVFHDVTIWPRSKRNTIFWMSGHHLTRHADRELCHSVRARGLLPVCS